MHTGNWLLCRSATSYYWKFFGQNFKQQLCGSFLCAQFSSEKFKRTLHPSAEKLHHWGVDKLERESHSIVGEITRSPNPDHPSLKPARISNLPKLTIQFEILCFYKTNIHSWLNKLHRITHYLISKLHLIEFNHTEEHHKKRSHDEYSFTQNLSETCYNSNITTA